MKSYFIMTFIFTIMMAMLSCSTTEEPVPVTPQIESVAYEPCCGLDTLVIRLDEEWVAIPNVFTPNGDGINDRFYPITSNDSIRITVFRIYDTIVDPFNSRVLMYSTSHIDYNLIDVLSWNGTKRYDGIKSAHKGIFTYSFRILYKEYYFTVEGQACAIVCDEEAPIFRDKAGCFFVGQFDADGNPSSSLPSGEEEADCFGE